MNSEWENIQYTVKMSTGDYYDVTSILAMIQTYVKYLEKKRSIEEENSIRQQIKETEEDIDMESTENKRWKGTLNG